MEELRQIVNMDSFLKLVKKCIVSDKLFSELLHVFVEKIVVHPPDKSSDRCSQQIDIHYHFIRRNRPFTLYQQKKEPDMICQ
mgnify:CR=1 FL=1